MLSNEKIDELIELIDDEIPVRDVPVTICTYRPAIREAVRKWYAAQQKMHPTLGESSASDSESTPTPKQVI